MKIIIADSQALTYVWTWKEEIHEEVKFLPINLMIAEIAKQASENTVRIKSERNITQFST